MTHDPQKRAINKRPSPILIILILLLLAGAIYLGWLKYGAKHPTVISEQSIEEQAPPPETAPPATGEAVAPTVEGKAPADAQTEAMTAPPPEDPCESVSGEILQYFDYLNKQEYITARNFDGGIQGHVTKMLDKLYANPPVVVGETDNLYTVLQNTAHFYRVLGKDNIFLVKKFLELEGDNIESTMSLFYQWSTLWDQCTNTGVSVRLPLEDLYEYAGFFLNTLGGQSYLFRRESKVRMLSKYYCILILDRANDRGINAHGLDIRPYINSLIEEMDSTDQLSMKDEYIGKLLSLRDKYHSQYGINSTMPPSQPK